MVRFLLSSKAKQYQGGCGLEQSATTPRSVLRSLLFLEGGRGRAGEGGEKSRREKGGLTEERKRWEGRPGGFFVPAIAGGLGGSQAPDPTRQSLICPMNQPALGWNH
nr:unnamed protein product [Digitaria exilis]